MTMIPYATSSVGDQRPLIVYIHWFSDFIVSTHSITYAYSLINMFSNQVLLMVNLSHQSYYYFKKDYLMKCKKNQLCRENEWKLNFPGFLRILNNFNASSVSHNKSFISPRMFMMLWFSDCTIWWVITFQWGHLSNYLLLNLYSSRSKLLFLQE